jgi:PAS domain S-box-containing protein
MKGGPRTAQLRGRDGQAGQVIESPVDVSKTTTPQADLPVEALPTGSALDRFLRLCDCLPLAVFETEVDDHCLYFNPRWGEITGQTADEAGGHGWRDAIHACDSEWVLEEVQLARGQKRMFDADFRVQRPDGSVRWVHGRSLPLYAADGTHDGFVHAIYDITDRKLTESTLRTSLAELKEQSELQGEQIRGVVAQLRDLLEEVAALDERVDPTLDLLRKSAAVEACVATST